MAKKHKQPKGFEPGIYFNMSNEEYHADPALSHSGMVKLLISPLDYWITGPLNPDKEPWRDEKRGTARWFGKMRHELLLERERFWRTYKVIGMTSDDHSAFTWLTREEYRDIKAAIDEIRNVPEASQFFSEGYPEVSIFWRDAATGLMMRCRIDWLRIFGGLDFKQARSLLNNQLGWQIADFGYDLQEVHYTEGLRQIKMALKSGKAKAHGTYDPAWLKAFIDDPDIYFRFFFQRSEPPYIYRILAFDSEILKNAQVRIDDAKAIYQTYIEEFGASRWPAGKCAPEEFSIYHLPKRIFD